eukprot:COSAG02_NODE_2243_length_9392_cov_12.624449_6_plen_121_part_00
MGGQLGQRAGVVRLAEPAVVFGLLGCFGSHQIVYILHYVYCQTAMQAYRYSGETWLLSLPTLPSRYCRVTRMHGRVNVSILHVLMFRDIGSDEMDSTVLNSSRAGQFPKRLKELVWNSAF